MPVSIAPPKILNTARVAPQHGSILCLSKNKQTISSNSSPAYMRKLNCKTKFQLKWVKWNLHLQVSTGNSTHNKKTAGIDAHHTNACGTNQIPLFASNRLNSLTTLEYKLIFCRRIYYHLFNHGLKECVIKFRECHVSVANNLFDRL